MWLRTQLVADAESRHHPGYVPRIAVEVPSRSGGLPHHVSRLPDGRWSCTCRGFEFRESCWAVTETQARFAASAVVLADLL